MFAKPPAIPHPDFTATHFRNAAPVIAGPVNPSEPPASSDETTDDGVVTIGKGSHISGDVTHCLKLVVQGSVEGRISAETLVLREGGTLKGEIHAINAEINGSITGVIEVKHLLDIRATGRVEGELAYGKLAVAMGGHITGQIKTAQSPGETEVDNDDLPDNVSFLHPSS